MGGHQVKACINCKFFDTPVYLEPCDSCTVDYESNDEWSNWQSKRGRAKGSKSKPGSKKTGSIPKPSGELMCFPVLSIRANDLKAYGGPDKLKADVKLMVETKLK